MDKLPWETFEILDIDEAPPCHSNGFYILVNSFSFTLTFSLLSVRLVSFEHAMTIVGYLYLFFEKILCLMLIFFTSMFLVVYNLNSRDRTVARQLNFNHRIVKVQTQNKSAVKWVVLVTCVFLLCYGIFLHCSLLFLAGHKCGNDFYYKITPQVINSGINRKVYAFFKRDKKQECGRLLFKRRRYLTTEQFRRKKNIS